MVVPNDEPSKPKRSRRKSLPVPVPVSSAPLQVINPDAAGIDVHSDMHMVCVPADREAEPVRQFGANTADLQEIGVGIHRHLLDSSVRTLGVGRL
jgi:hypothetical protein